MTRLHEDDGLRERFRQLRAETARPGSVPDFGDMLARAKGEAVARPRLEAIGGASQARRLVRAGAWASAALAATLAGLLVTNGNGGEDADFARLVAAYSTDVSTGAWRSPTARLLEVPGMELVRSLPSVGTSLRGIDPASLPQAPDREENG